MSAKDFSGQIDRVNNEGNSTLYIMCNYGHLLEIKRLLSMKANPNTPNLEMNTPLHAAVRKKD